MKGSIQPYDMLIKTKEQKYRLYKSNNHCNEMRNIRKETEGLFMYFSCFNEDEI